MYAGDRLKGKLGGFLKIAVLLFMVYVIAHLALMLVDRVEASDGGGHTMTTSDADEDSSACQNAEGNATLNGAGIKVPVKCKKK